jgi:TonB family protein
VTGYAQKSKSPGEMTSPKPVDGSRNYKKYLKENTIYPSAAIENKIEGVILLEFIVDSNGNLKDFRIARGLGFGLDEEAIRLVKNGPKWHPGFIDGYPNIQKVILKIPFKLK